MSRAISKEIAVVKRNFVVLLAAGFVWGAVGASTAHAQLTRSEQLFLYLNYYQQQRNTQAIRSDQAKQQLSLDRLGQNQQSIVRDMAAVPSYSRYLAPGRSSPQVERANVPAIYAGQGGQRQYFLQQGRYFNPPH
jgi:hypothetical protein